MSYLIAISNEKGGVAKTTTALSLGAALVEMDKSVLLIDLDPQANLTLAMGFEPAKIEHTIADVFINSMSLLEIILHTGLNKIDILPSNLSLEQVEQSLPLQLNYASRLRDAIASTAPFNYDIVLMDCPPSLGAMTFNALAAAHLLIIPTQAEYFSAYALRDMMNIIRQVRAEENPALAYRILVTMLDQRNRTHRDIRDQLERTFGEGLFKTVIEIDTKLRESPIVGVPITQYKPNSRGALQYRTLAEELMQYVEQTH